MLDDLAAADGPVDLIAGLAFPLPFVVITEMLGMPEADRDQLREWSHTVVQSLDPILAVTKLRRDPRGVGPHRRARRAQRSSGSAAGPTTTTSSPP